MENMLYVDQLRHQRRHPTQAKYPDQSAHGFRISQLYVATAQLLSGSPCRVSEHVPRDRATTHNATHAFDMRRNLQISLASSIGILNIFELCELIFWGKKTTDTSAAAVPPLAGMGHPWRSMKRLCGRRPEKSSEKHSVRGPCHAAGRVLAETATYPVD